MARRKRLKIAINTLSAKAGGGITHLINLLPELAKLDKVNSYEILVAPEKQDVFRVDAPNFRVIPCRFPSRSAIFRLLWEQVFLPIYTLFNRIDVLYCPLNSAPFLPTAPQVCTIRMAPDEVLSVQRTWNRKFFWLAQSIIIWLSAHASTRVMAISEFLKQKLVRLYRVPADRIDVVHHGRSMAFYPVDRDEARAFVRERFGVEKPYALVVADLYRHKNCELIIELLERLRRQGHPDLHLIWAGTLFDTDYTRTVLDLVQRRHLTDHIHFIGSVGPEILRSLYSGAECFLFMSLSEMFGQPLVEAMSCEVPVVTSDLPVMREIAGEAALFVSPTDVDACFQCVSRLLSDRKLQRELIEHGRRRKNFFSWERGAQRLLDVFNKAKYHRERKRVERRIEPKTRRIVINALAARTGGGAVYLSNLLQALTHGSPNHDYLVLLNRNLRSALSGMPEGVSVRSYAFPLRSGLVRVLWEQIQLPRLLSKERVDLLFSPFNTGPLYAGCQSVLTVHVNFSEVRNLAQSWFARLRWDLLRLMSVASCHQAKRVIAVSRYAKSHLVQTTRVRSEKVQVVHHCCASYFKPIPPSIVKHVLADGFSLTRPYLLMVGDVYEYKNILRLVEAFAGLPDQPFHKYDLVLAGDVINARYMAQVVHHADKLGCVDRLKWIGSVKHYALPPIYSGAVLSVMPSLTETFGMPIIESMACGTPVVASRIPAFEEVSGGASILFDPLNVQDMREALQKVLTDESLRESLQQKGLQRASLFSTERFANETLSVIEQVLNNKTG